MGDSINGTSSKPGKDVNAVLNGSFTGLPEGNRRNRSFKLCSISIDRDTLPLKLCLFLYYGAMAAILPFLTVHMLSIGISIRETAIIYGVLPFTAFVGPPVIGVLADKLGQYKMVLIAVTVANAISHLLLIAVPIYSETPIMAPVQLNWGADLRGFYLSPASQDHCGAFAKHFESLNSTQLSGVISACRGNTRYLSDLNAMGDDNGTDTTFDTDIDSVPKVCATRGSDNFKGLLGVICSQFNATESDENWMNNTKTATTFHLEQAQSCLIPVKSSVSNTNSWGAFGCQTNITIDTGEKLIHGSNPLTFWLYFIFRILATIFMSACYTMMDAAVLAVCKKNPRARFGIQRIFGVLGQAIMSPLGGILVDVFSRGKPQKDYTVAFHLATFLFLLNVLAYCLITLDVEQRGKNILRNSVKLCKYPEVVTFLGMMFLLGNMWGFVKSYLFVLLKNELQAPTYLLGLTVTVGCVISIPILYWADKIVDKVGRVNVIAASFLVYCIRFIAYSYLDNAWWSLPFEGMEALTYHLMWTAAATYCGVLAPKGLLATMSGIMGTLHFRLGQGSGSFIGGYVIEAFTMRTAFLQFGVASAICGVIYIILNYTWIEKLMKRRKMKQAAEATADGAEMGNGKANDQRAQGDKGDEGAGEAMLPQPKTIS